MSEPRNIGVKTLGIKVPDALHAQFALVAQLDGLSLGDAALRQSSCTSSPSAQKPTSPLGHKPHSKRSSVKPPPGEALSRGCLGRMPSQPRQRTSPRLLTQPSAVDGDGAVSRAHKRLITQGMERRPLAALHSPTQRCAYLLFGTRSTAPLAERPTWCGPDRPPGTKPNGPEASDEL